MLGWRLLQCGVHVGELAKHILQAEHPRLWSITVEKHLDRGY